MPPSPPAPLNDDEIDTETLGPLAAIPEASLVQLASNIAGRALKTSASVGKVAQRIIGSYNIVHVLEIGDLKLVIRVPATG